MLKVEANGPVVTMTLNRPEVRNALNRELIDALQSAFDRLHVGCRVVVLQGEGKSFCAGGDLEWMRQAANCSAEENDEDAKSIAFLFKTIAESAPVTIVKAHGHAFGGGGGIIAAADCALATFDTLFSFSEVKLGLIPATISPYVIAKIGSGHARTLFTTGIQFNGQRAYEIGLLSHVCAAEKIDEVLEGLIQSVLSCGPEAIRDARRLTLEEPLGAIEAATRLAQARARSEGKEGTSAFLERRPASFVVKWPLSSNRHGESN